MKREYYVKDTKAFWRERFKARTALDKKRKNAPYSEKVMIAGKLRADADFIKSGQIVSSKT